MKAPLRWFPVILALLFSVGSGFGRVRPSHLRCEYRTNPLGVDSVHPRLSWILNSSERDQVQTAYQIAAATSEAQLRTGHPDVWDSGKVASDETSQVFFAGKPLTSAERVYWRVRCWDGKGAVSDWSPIAFWQMGLLDPGDWHAHWIGLGASDDNRFPHPAPYLRKKFSLDQGVRRASLSITALGLYEAHINGERVSDHILAPEWTDYDKRVQYQTYDVTALVHRGSNALGVILGDGWYAGKIGLTGIVPHGPKRAIYGKYPRLLLQLDIVKNDGSRERIVSDGSWRGSDKGPIRADDLLDGEVDDARQLLPGWDEPEFNDSDWCPVEVFHPIRAQLVAQFSPPIRVMRELRPVKLTEPKPGIYVYDLGQNMVGWCRFKVRGERGQTVTLQHGEVLNPDGTVYTKNLRGAAERDQFIPAGSGVETFEPRFTYHGFRYVEVHGLRRKPSRRDLTGCVFYSSAPTTGEFSCSSPLLNHLMRNIVWTQRGNLEGIPTDCPQRDERMGWMGDAQIFAPTACFNMDMEAFYTKWLRDVRDAQTRDGRFPDFAPHPYNPEVRFSGVPAWGDAGVIVPWVVYVTYGDRRILEANYSAAKRWIGFIHQHNPDLIWRHRRGNDYNDWLNGDTLKLAGWPKKGAAVPKDVFATAYFAYSTSLVAKMAEVLNQKGEAKEYRALADAIKKAFVHEFVDADGRVKGDTQAGYALALNFGLVPEALHAAAVRHLVAAVHRYHDHVSTGFPSTIRMMLELTRGGHNDLAYKLINNRTIPSWGYMIDHGGTTIWERWDGYVAGRGFQDPGMNSFNHYAIGAVGEWMWRNIAGINPDPAHPGYQHFTIHPRPGGGVTWARTEYDSVRGAIRSDWKQADNAFQLSVSVPANTRATIYLPADSNATVTEEGRPANQAPGVHSMKRQGDNAVLEVGSGEYAFQVEAR